MSQIVSYDDFSHGRYEKTGETIIVVNAEGKILATIDPNIPYRGKQFPFRDLDFETPLGKLSIDPTEVILKGRGR